MSYFKYSSCQTFIKSKHKCIYLFCIYFSDIFYGYFFLNGNISNLSYQSIICIFSSLELKRALRESAVIHQQFQSLITKKWLCQMKSSMCDLQHFQPALFLIWHQKLQCKKNWYLVLEDADVWYTLFIKIACPWI